MSGSGKYVFPLARECARTMFENIVNAARGGTAIAHRRRQVDI